MPWEFILLQEIAQTRRHKRKISTWAKRWPSTMIPYDFESGGKLKKIFFSKQSFCYQRRVNGNASSTRRFASGRIKHVWTLCAIRFQQTKCVFLRSNASTVYILTSFTVLSSKATAAGRTSVIWVAVKALALARGATRWNFVKKLNKSL